MAFEIPTSRRLTLALLLSLLIHALLLSLTFGGQGRGLPGIGFPWQERRFEAPDLRVVLMPMKVTATEPADTSSTSVAAAGKDQAACHRYADAQTIAGTIPNSCVGASTRASAGDRDSLAKNCAIRTDRTVCQERARRHDRHGCSGCASTDPGTHSHRRGACRDGHIRRATATRTICTTGTNACRRSYPKYCEP
jgi:hypothetical protein